jgi:hypothetical protein
MIYFLSRCRLRPPTPFLGFFETCSQYRAVCRTSYISTKHALTCVWEGGGGGGAAVHVLGCMRLSALLSDPHATRQTPPPPPLRPNLDKHMPLTPCRNPPTAHKPAPYPLPPFTQCSPAHVCPDGAWRRDLLKVQRPTDLPFYALTTGVLALLLGLSAVMYAGGVDYPTIGAVLALAAIVNWAVFDATLQVG